MGRGSLKASQEGVEKAKKALNYRGLTQKALAEDLGISRSTISKFFNHKNVDRWVFEEVCQRLELDWKEIFEKPLTKEKSEIGNQSQNSDKQENSAQEQKQEESSDINNSQTKPRENITRNIIVYGNYNEKIEGNNYQNSSDSERTNNQNIPFNAVQVYGIGNIVNLTCNVSPDIETKASGSYSIYELIEDGSVMLLKTLKEKTIIEIEREANNGNPESLYLLGIAKWRGISTDKDLEESRFLFQQAAFQGFKRATLAYGSMLHDGLGGIEDKESAIRWWKAGHKQEYAPCTAMLGRYYVYGVPKEQINFKQARQYLDEASSKGNVYAKALLGDFLWFGEDRPVDKKAALELYEKATEGCAKDDVTQCSTLALYRIANAYQYGIAYPIDKKRAFEMYKKSYQLGDNDAAFSAATMLIDGDGLEKNYNKAALLLIEAVERDSFKAAAKLSNMIINKYIEPIPGRDAQRMAIEADEKGYPEGINALIGSLLNGKNGYKTDIQRAALLANQALERFNKRSIDKEGAWPLYKKTFATAIEIAIENKIMDEKDVVVSLSDLKRFYSSKNKVFMRRFTIPVNYDSLQAIPFEIYIWDAEEDSFISLKQQLDWVEQARGCKVSQDVRTYFDQLYAIAKENKVSFLELATYTFREAAKKKEGK